MKFSTALSGFALAIVLSMGAFAGVAHADDWGDSYSFDGGWGDSYSYDGGSGSWGDSYSYDGGSAWGDSYSTDGGWGDSYSYDGGSLYTNDGNLYTNDGGGNLYSYDGSTGNLYTNDGNLYTADGGNLYTVDGNGNLYTADDNYTYVDEYLDEYQQQYMDTYASGNPVFGGGSMGGFGGFGGGSFGGGSYGGYSFPTGGCTNCHSTPSYPTPCTTCYHPTPVPHPTPTCTTCGGSNVTNTNINTNTNTYIDNSINGSFNTTVKDSYNTTMLAPVVPQPIVQYVGVPQYQQALAPYCVITLQNAGMYNAQATLVWSSSNATTGYITSIGTVAPNGTRVVTGYANQVYQLTVTGNGGSYTCQTQQFTPGYIAPAPINPSVSLTQIPYTGLALGPVAQALYWLSIFGVAAAGAYLLVYFKGGALSLAAASMTRRSNHIVVSEQEADEIEAPVEEAAEEPTVSPVNVFDLLPAMAETKTRDAMAMIRDASGMPKIVISRA